MNPIDFEVVIDYIQKQTARNPISMMHFQDPYTFDLERVSHCDINYSVPDGRTIPFCTMNTIHRAISEEKFSIPIEEWRERRRPDKVEEDLSPNLCC